VPVRCTIFYAVYKIEPYLIAGTGLKINKYRVMFSPAALLSAVLGCLHARVSCHQAFNLVPVLVEGKHTHHVMHWHSSQSCEL